MKIKHIIVTIFTSIGLFSCDDFLNEPNPNTITEDSFWRTKDDFVKGLMATYNALQATYVMGGNNATAGHVMSDIAMSSPWDQGNIELNDFIATDVTHIVSNKWHQLYTGIFRANQVLENLSTADFDSGFKTLMEAEARFLRGLFYFWLVTNYNQGAVIIHTGIPRTIDEFYKPVSPKSNVYNLVLDDLTFAQDHLPQTWDSGNLGRATWGAATAIIGQAFLYEGRFEEAGQEFKKIIDSDLYALTPHISWNFDLEHEHNSESIFEVNFSDVVKPGEDPNHATSRAARYAPQEAGGDRNVEPAYNLIELYKRDPIDPNNPINQGQQFSQRALASIVFKGDGQEFYQRPSSDFPFIVGQEAHVKKFQNWTWPQEPIERRSGINERVVRLADVYLMYAETVLKTTEDVGEAIYYINLVRTRSGVLQLNAANFDAESLMVHLMRVERPLELSFEGHMIRWQDIKRWGIVKQLFDELSQITYRSLPSGLREATAEDFADPNAVLVRQFVNSSQNYNAEEDDYFPLPNQERITNNQLSEMINPGN